MPDDGRLETVATSPLNVNGLAICVLRSSTEPVSVLILWLVSVAVESNVLILWLVSVAVESNVLIDSTIAFMFLAFSAGVVPF